MSVACKNPLNSADKQEKMNKQTQEGEFLFSQDQSGVLQPINIMR